jgi:hypothetical protein
VVVKCWVLAEMTGSLPRSLAALSPEKSRYRTSAVLELHMYDKGVNQELAIAFNRTGVSFSYTRTCVSRRWVGFPIDEGRFESNP